MPELGTCCMYYPTPATNVLFRFLVAKYTGRNHDEERSWETALSSPEFEFYSKGKTVVGESETPICCGFLHVTARVNVLSELLSKLCGA